MQKLQLVLSAILLCQGIRYAAADPAPSPAGVLAPFVESGQLAGAVTLVADKERVLELAAIGRADIANAKPLQTNSLFWIASQSKPMTAAAFMMLVDEGKVSLDDPVEKHLPEFKGQMVAVEKNADHVLLRKPAHPITIREILSHTSGLPFSTPIEQPTLDGLRLRDAVRSYAMTPLQSEPGAKYSYSNAGINTAGRIIEVLSGMPYETFLQKRLLDPLGMSDTTFWPSEEQLSRLAKAYKPNSAKTALEETPVTQLHYPLTDRTERFPMPAGGLFSTAADTARFCQMILNGGVFAGRRVLSTEAVRELTRKQTAQSIDTIYGLGFSGNKEDQWGHGGAYATNMSIDRSRALIAIWMVQHSGFVGDGGKAQKAFQDWALSQFGSVK